MLLLLLSVLQGAVQPLMPTGYPAQGVRGAEAERASGLQLPAYTLLRSCEVTEPNGTAVVFLISPSPQVWVVTGGVGPRTENRCPQAPREVRSLSRTQAGCLRGVDLWSACNRKEEPGCTVIQQRRGPEGLVPKFLRDLYPQHCRWWALRWAGMSTSQSSPHQFPKEIVRLHGFFINIRSLLNQSLSGRLNVNDKNLHPESSAHFAT